MTCDPVRFGVVGLGRAFMLMLPGFRADPRVKLVAAAAPREQSRNAFEAEFGGRTYADIKGLCADPEVEAIYVATPHQFHCAHVIAAAKAGKHVLVDKPLSVSMEDGTAMVSAAREAGIDHIVYTSLASPVPESPITFSKDHQDTETLIEQSGASYTILRNNLYTDLLLMSGPQAIGMGQLIAAAGDGRASYVTRADCARAAAAALMNATGREVLDITGPESTGQADIAALLSDIAGKDIPYVPMPAEDMVQAMIANGLPEFMARVFVSFDQAIAEGYLDVASDDLKTLTGKSGQSVTDFLTENRAVLLRAPQ